MKTINFTLGIFFLVILFVGCKDPDDPITPNQPAFKGNPYLGTWRLDSIHYYIYNANTNQHSHIASKCLDTADCELWVFDSTTVAMVGMGNGIHPYSFSIKEPQWMQIEPGIRDWNFRDVQMSKSSLVLHSSLQDQDGSTGEYYFHLKPIY